MMKHFEQVIALLSISIFGVVMAGCGANAPVSETKALVSQESNDVQLLQMWRDKSIEFKVNHCSGPIPDDGQTVTKDCSAQGADFAKVSWTNSDSPSINPWTLPVYKYQGGTSSRFVAGHLVEVRLLVKKSVMEAATFSGIGFYFNNNMFSEIRTIAKSELHVVSTSPLYLAGTGEEAVALRFVAYMPGIAGNSATGWAMDSFALKPFAEFNDGQDIYQNWEKTQENFRVYRYTNAAGRSQIINLDRSSELLQQ